MINHFGKNMITISMNRIIVYLGTALVSVFLLLLSLVIVFYGWTILLHPLAIISVLWGSFCFINNESRINKINIKSTPHTTVKKTVSLIFFIEGITAFPRYIYFQAKQRFNYEYLASHLLSLLFILASILFVFALSDSWLEAVVFITLMFCAILLMSFMFDKSPAFVLFILKAMQFFAHLFGGENKKELELEDDINWKDVIIVTLILLLLLYALISPSHLSSLLETVINTIL